GDALLVHSMRDPASVPRLDAEALDDVLHAARRHVLLARLEHDLASLGVLQDLPEAARRQFANARIETQANAITLRFEADRVRRALAGLGIRIVLLKGAAYLRAGLPPARGRFSVDLDILVPAADIGRVEWTLINGGWEPAKMNAYDQHYYRDWMHQIPPLTHGVRGVELDVHHTIFPPVSGVRIDSETLLADATPAGDGLWILSPADMVLHAATHLFQEDPAGRLRDLLDLHDLLTLFGQHAGFWEALAGRARRLGLGRPLYYSLRYAADLTGTAIPAAVLAQAKAAFAPNAVQLRVMDWLVRAAIVAGSSGQGGSATVARFLLFVRSHWIKMPLNVLLSHAAVKLFHRMRERNASEKS
ncbi:MAG: nucleotidyltransferase family protein, partial [Nevskia sp.]|nr:nucleotidyltransferase family protein [Nevskia sp.]